jgi:hypothetical protein
MAALDSAPRGATRRTARVYARRLGVSVGVVFSKRSAFRKSGPIVLVDKRASAEFWPARGHALPIPAAAHLKKLAGENFLSSESAIRAFRLQLKRWRRGDASARIPGYSKPPVGNPPPGWSARNLARHLPAPSRRNSRIIRRIVFCLHANGTVTSGGWGKP